MEPRVESCLRRLRLSSLVRMAVQGLKVERPTKLSCAGHATKLQRGTCSPQLNDTRINVFTKARRGGQACRRMINTPTGLFELSSRPEAGTIFKAPVGLSSVLPSDCCVGQSHDSSVMDRVRNAKGESGRGGNRGCTAPALHSTGHGRMKNTKVVASRLRSSRAIFPCLSFLVFMVSTLSAILLRCKFKNFAFLGIFFFRTGHFKCQKEGSF